jgi:hypothetical protein
MQNSCLMLPAQVPVRKRELHTIYREKPQVHWMEMGMVISWEAGLIMSGSLQRFCTVYAAV